MASTGASQREPFPGCLELFACIADLRLACAVVSNTFWWGDAEMRRCFDGLGTGSPVDAYVTSLDVGVRKPHRAMFDAGLAALDRAPEECVFIGNHERMDIEPASALRMRTIRVAIEEPVRAASAADAVVDSLEDAARVLRAWA